MRYRLRTLLIWVAISPALLAGLSAALFLGWARWSGADPPVNRVGNIENFYPPWDENSFEGKLTQGQAHSYSLMSDAQKAEYRRQKGYP